MLSLKTLVMLSFLRYIVQFIFNLCFSKVAGSTIVRIYTILLTLITVSSNQFLETKYKILLTITTSIVCSIFDLMEKGGIRDISTPWEDRSIELRLSMIRAPVMKVATVLFLYQSSILLVYLVISSSLK